MYSSFKKNNLVSSAISSTLYTLPAPANILIYWNFGSILFVILMFQILSGLILICFFYSNSLDGFANLSEFVGVNTTWILRYLHANGASFFFLFMYMHMGRGIYFLSYKNSMVWIIGLFIYLLSMMTAFVGYVLPMNQMSFWAASVITSLLGEVPYIGSELIKLVWGNIFVGNFTINRFMMLHFLVPMIIFVLVMMHIMYLHYTGSVNPLGLFNKNLVYFHGYFYYKDFLMIFIYIFFYMFVIVFNSLQMGDNENFVEADPSITPAHIKPEWYFLFAYAILRSIPTKFGGIMALFMSIFILFLIPYMYKPKMMYFMYPINKMLFKMFVLNLLLLTWVGGMVVEDPYILLGQLLSFTYFLYFFMNSFMYMYTDYLLSKI